jgi:hypothetical protein
MNCLNCGTVFDGKKGAKYCSYKCRRADWDSKNPDKVKAHREMDRENNRQRSLRRYYARMSNPELAEKERERQRNRARSGHNREHRREYKREKRNKERAARPIRHCVVCCAELPPTSTRRLYCSQRCASKANRPIRPGRCVEVRICQTCNGTFVTEHPTKKYCSTACHIKSILARAHQGAVKNCEHCGKETTRRRYCSPECWAEARRIKQSRNKQAFLSTDKGKEYRKVHTSRNNQRRKGDKAGIDFTPAQWRAALRYFDHKCAYCGEKLTKAEQEHYFPLSKGGRLTRSNIIPACPACNNKKSNRDPIEWIAGLPNALVAYARITLYFMQVSH